MPLYIYTGWWFGTFFIFHNIWENPSHWLIFFKMVKTTNQYITPYQYWDLNAERTPLPTARYVCCFITYYNPIMSHLTIDIASITWTFLRYTKKCSETKNAHFRKKCYKPLKSAHLVVSFCRAPPHVQTAGSPRILATYTDTITLCLGSRCLGSPQPTSFAAASSKSSNSLGWAELDT